MSTPVDVLAVLREIGKEPDPRLAGRAGDGRRGREPHRHELRPGDRRGARAAG